MTAETGFVPKYQKIINELHAMLRQGVLKPGDKLPSREELVERYGVTRATVNRAVGELLREGLLKAAQRGGTFVSDAPEIEEKPHSSFISNCLWRISRNGTPRSISTPCSDAFSSSCPKKNARFST